MDIWKGKQMDKCDMPIRLGNMEFKLCKHHAKHELTAPNGETYMFCTQHLKMALRVLTEHGFYYEGEKECG